MGSGSTAWACCDECGAFIPDNPARARLTLRELLAEYGWAWGEGYVKNGGGWRLRCPDCTDRRERERRQAHRRGRRPWFDQ